MHQMPPEFTIAPRARAAIKGHWQTALLIAFGAGILHTIFQVVYTLMTGPAMERLIVLAEQGYPAAYMLQWLKENLLPSLLPLGILGLVAVLVSPALSMGYHAYALKLLKGEAGSFRDLFSRLPIFLQSLGLSVMIGLRIVLWTLPGIAAFYAIAFGILFANGMNMNALTYLAPLATAALLPGIMAAYRYLLAPYAMAEEPVVGINEAIGRSKALTRGRKMRLFTMLIGWSLLSQMANIVLQALLGPVIGLAFGMLAALACSVYMELLTASFYLTFRTVDGCSD